MKIFEENSFRSTWYNFSTFSGFIFL